MKKIVFQASIPKTKFLFRSIDCMPDGDSGDTTEAKLKALKIETKEKQTKTRSSAEKPAPTKKVEIKTRKDIETATKTSKAKKVVSKGPESILDQIESTLNFPKPHDDHPALKEAVALVGIFGESSAETGYNQTLADLKRQGWGPNRSNNLG